MKRKRLVLIHTVNWYERAVMEPFAREFAAENPEVELTNIMDDSLLVESLRNGGPTPAVIRRMMFYAMAAESAGADVIMCSCTTMGKATRLARAFISVPFFNIDEPMAKQAVAAGGTIVILATVPTSAPATRALLEQEAERAGKRIRVETVINEEAFSHLQAGEVDRHDALVCKEVDRLAQSVDVIALGQISLSKICHRARVPILQVGRSGFAEARRLLNGGR